MNLRRGWSEFLNHDTSCRAIVASTTRTDMSNAFKPLSLHGSIGLRAASLLRLACAAVVTVLRRPFTGSLRPSWTLAFEIATRFFKAQDARVRAIAATGDIARCRAIADSLVFYRPALNAVCI